MIYTVTLNPSLDYVVDVKDFRTGEVNRSGREVILPGGKGINVSLMLKELGCETRAMGFLAGFTGLEIRRLLAEAGLDEDFLLTERGFSRINVKLRSTEETEINGAGPEISAEEREAFLRQLKSTLRAGDTLVISGSAPPSLGADIYEEMLRVVSEKGVRAAVDISGKALFGLLSFRPFLVKPNHHELGDLFGVTVRSAEDAAFYARKLVCRGAENVLVSLAGDGAVLVTESDAYYAAAPKGTVVNSVGAGDSAVAGFLAGMLSGKGEEYALSLAVSAGSATAFSEGIAKAEDVRALQNTF